jgi:SAM-dependent methyltransferase
MTEMTAAAAADITEHNRRVWGRTAAGYVNTFQQLTGGATTVLLDLAGVGRSTELLDIGTGPGTLIGPAAARGARVSAIDVTPEMVARAREDHPGADIRVGEGESLPFGAGSFDAVTLGFCLHHVADPSAVLREVRRVLRPGGRLSFAVWAPADQLEAFGVAFAAVAEVGAAADVPSVPPPPIADQPDGYEDLLIELGFVTPTARVVDLAWTLPDGAAMFDGFDAYFDLTTQPAAVRAALRRRLDEEVGSRAGPDGLARIPNPAVVAAARRPDMPTGTRGPDEETNKERTWHSNS